MLYYKPLIFYLRDEARPFGLPKPKLERKRRRSPVELKIGPPQGRPVVSVAAIEVPMPYESMGIAFWVHFCVASCCPVDLGDVEDRTPDPGFSKEFGRQVALDRLAKRKTHITVSKRDWKRNTLTFHSRVGEVIPISSNRLTSPLAYRGAVVRRVITEHIAEGKDFPPTARTLAKRWLGPKYGTSSGVELTEDLLINLAEEAEKGYEVSRLQQRQSPKG